MGLHDIYPFVLNVDLLRKLEFVHGLIRDSRDMKLAPLADEDAKAA